MIVCFRIASDKKMHEVVVMSDVISRLATSFTVDSVIDLVGLLNIFSCVTGSPHGIDGCSTTPIIVKMYRIFFFLLLLLLPSPGRSLIYSLFNFHFSYVLSYLLRVKYNNMLIISLHVIPNWRSPFNRLRNEPVHPFSCVP